MTTSSPLNILKEASKCEGAIWNVKGCNKPLADAAEMGAVDADVCWVYDLYRGQFIRPHAAALVVVPGLACEFYATIKSKFNGWVITEASTGGRMHGASAGRGFATINEALTDALRLLRSHDGTAEAFYDRLRKSHLEYGYAHGWDFKRFEAMAASARTEQMEEKEQ